VLAELGAKRGLEPVKLGVPLRDQALRDGHGCGRPAEMDGLRQGDDAEDGRESE
jgi:hypothetical protein